MPSEYTQTLLNAIKKIRQACISQYLILTAPLVNMAEISSSVPEEEKELLSSLSKSDNPYNHFWRFLEAFLHKEYKALDTFSQQAALYHIIDALTQFLQKENFSQEELATLKSTLMGASLKEKKPLELQPEKTILYNDRDNQISQFTALFPQEKLQTLFQHLFTLDEGANPTLDRQQLTTDIIPILEALEAYNLPIIAETFRVVIQNNAQTNPSEIDYRSAYFIQLVDFIKALQWGFYCKDQMFTPTLYQLLFYEDAKNNFTTFLTIFTNRLKQDPEAAKKARFQKQLQDAYAALKSQLLIPLPSSLLDQLHYGIKNTTELKTTLQTLITYLKEEKPSLKIMITPSLPSEIKEEDKKESVLKNDAIDYDYDEEEATPSVTSEYSASSSMPQDSPMAESLPDQPLDSSSSLAFLPHPYYLQGFKPVTLKEAPDYDDELLAEIKEGFLEEIETEVFPSLKETLKKLQASPEDQAALKDLRRNFHTLKGSGYMVGLMYEGELAWFVETVLNDCLEKKYPFSEATWHHANDGFIAYQKRLTDEPLPETELNRLAFQADFLAQHKGIIPLQEDYQEDQKKELPDDSPSLEEKSHQPTSLSTPLPSPLLSPLPSPLLSPSAVKEAEAPPSSAPTAKATLKTDIYSNIDNIFHNLPLLIIQLKRGSKRVLQRFVNHLQVLSRYPQAYQHQMANQLIKAVRRNSLLYLAYGVTPKEERCNLWQEVLNQTTQLLQDSQSSEILTSGFSLEYYLKELDQKIIEYPFFEQQTQHLDSINEDIFIEFRNEALELIEQADDLIQQWQLHGFLAKAPELDELKRLMHTLKGSARMVGKDDIGHLTHAIESLFEEVNLPLFGKDERLYSLLERSLDYIPTMLETQSPLLTEEGHNLLSSISVLLGLDERLEEASTKPFAQTPSREVEKKPERTALTELSTIRVAPNKLNFLSENTAESIIVTAQQARDLNQTLTLVGELSHAINKISSQARRIEIGMESQITSRHTRMGDTKDFDPLELDRYSEFQELTRLLMESTNDLNSLQKSINENLNHLITRSDKSTKLQTAINTTLTEVRSESFNSIIPRLKRLCRQTAKTYNKNIELVTEGTELVVERVILEQLVVPFEHMIRNAIIHGIEDREQRKAAQKDEKGTISLYVRQIGNNLHITFADDGQGINIEKARERARELELLDTTTSVEDNELLELLMLPGMTTAQTLTEDAGRGVGLDILSKSLSLLNGKLTIANQPKQGLAFEIQIPFSLTTIETLTVLLDKTAVALPVKNIVAIDKIPRKHIDKEQLVYQQNTYQLISLAHLFSTENRPQRPENSYLLFYQVSIENKVHYFAFEIDEVLDKQATILYPLNPQVSHTPFLLGSSLLADGSIIFILNLDEICTNTQLQNTIKERKAIAQKESHQDTSAKLPSILIVDDSITMRRASSRIVERMGLEAKTATDGLDAIEKLQKSRPDLILLDIEMPRMDGFEFLSYIRSLTDYQTIPVIMVTSRTGEKHRKKARSLGVDDYCGKPYQESELIAIIERLLKKKM